MGSKLDENLPVDLAEVFREAGHDAVTVLDQHLVGARNSDLASVCRDEGRGIVTFDTDFADIRTYPPAFGFGNEGRAEGAVLRASTDLDHPRSVDCPPPARESRSFHKNRARAAAPQRP